MLDFIKAQLSNQLVCGGMILLFTGSIVALARSLPKRFAEWLRRRLVLEVEILNSDPLFDFVTFWLNAQSYSRRARRLTAVSRLRVGEDDDNKPACSGDERNAPEIFLFPAPGQHVFWYKRNILWLSRDREESPASNGMGSGLLSLLKRETYHIRLIGRNQHLIRLLIEEIVAFGASSNTGIKIYNSSFGYWKAMGVMNPRSLGSVILPNGTSTKVLAELREFLDSEAWYRSVGIPWHFGCLLHGVPGSGKTSLVAALAGELHLDLYCMSLSGTGMDDERLNDLMSNVRQRTIVLIEDIDCTIPQREDRKGVTLGGLLNCLDGIQSREGCIIFMTTNHVKALDAALIRPGRVDLSVEFGYATIEQVLRLRDVLAPALSDEEASGYAGMSMAHVQQQLLQPSQPPCEVNSI
jgi:chaperone BCS1